MFFIIDLIALICAIIVPIFIGWQSINNGFDWITKLYSLLNNGDPLNLLTFFMIGIPVVFCFFGWFLIVVTFVERKTQKKQLSPAE